MLTALPEDQPRVVVLRAAGRAFCGGVDIKVRSRPPAPSAAPPPPFPGRPALPEGGASCSTTLCALVPRWRLPPCQAAEAGVGGKAWDYKDMRSQQLLSRLVEKMRQVPQPVIAAVQVRVSSAWLRVGLPMHPAVHLQTGTAPFELAPSGLPPLQQGPGPGAAERCCSTFPADAGVAASTMLGLSPSSLPCPRQGAAAGGGFALALASDVRVASRDARFSAAFVRLGLTGTDMG